MSQQQSQQSQSQQSQYQQSQSSQWSSQQQWKKSEELSQDQLNDVTGGVGQQVTCGQQMATSYADGPNGQTEGQKPLFVTLDK